MPLQSAFDRIVAYDLETADARAGTQIYQFAGVACDGNLNFLPREEGEIELHVRPNLDVLGHPMAFLTHGIDIDRLYEVGVSEHKAARVISRFFRQPRTLLMGYNNNRFDDEVVRRTFYRNLMDPYEHEWKDDNRRFDLFKLVQMTYALRPDMLEWPRN
jgi:exodeoxyribonuclease-1